MNTHRDHLLEAAGLRVRFFWHVDRFAHEVWFSSGADWQRALSSVEGSADNAWPPSPPFQSLDVEDRDGRPVALLVGMAGTSHWSASAELDPSAACVRFDVACRIRDAGRHVLSSTYRHQRPGADRQVRIEAHDAASAERIERTGEIVSVTAVDSLDESPRTVRWRYHIAISAAGDTTPRSA